MKNTKNRISIANRLRQKMAGRTVIIVYAFSFLLVAGSLFVYFNLGQNQEAHGAVNGDYRSVSSGTWTTVSIWEKYTSLGWVPALTYPNNGDKTITIQTGTTVSITSSITLDEVVVDGQLTVSSGTLGISNVTGFDMTVNGTLDIISTLALGSNTTIAVNGTEILRNTGTITMGSSASTTIAANGRMRREGGTMPTTAGTWFISSGGTYQHAMNGGTIPTATWSSGSTCEVTGVTTTLPTGLTQTFKSFTWNCPAQSATLDNSTALKNISENLTLTSTGSGIMFFDQQGNNLTMTVGGNVTVNGASVYMCENGSDIMNVAGNLNVSSGLLSFCRSGATAYGNTSGIINLTGNFNVTGGLVDMSQYTGNNAGKGYGVINIKGNISVAAPGLITETQNSRGQIYFCGTTIQTYDSYNLITNSIDFIVNNGAILRCNNNILNSGGDFTLMAGGGLMIGSSDGITLTSLLGNIQVTGNRSYSTGADYTYEGIEAQVSGDGLPGTVRNLTLNNDDGLTMSVTSYATNLLTLTSGKITTGNFEVGVTNTSTSSIVGYSTSNYVIGNLRRSVLGTGAYIYPLGTIAYYEPATLTLAATTGFTSVLGTFVNANPINPAYPLNNIYVMGVLITDMLDYGYWTLTPNTALTGGTYSVTLNEQGYTNGNSNPLSYCVLKRANVNSPWQSLGTHTTNTQSQSNGVVTASRSAYTSFSHYGIGKSGGATLPIKLIYFHAKLNGGVVNLDWATANEINNNFFTIERSIDGEHFEMLMTKRGAGNSTSNLYYNMTDNSPLSGTSYYRLKQTDYDGHFTYCDVQTVKNNDDSHSMGNLEIKTVGPNPFESTFDVNYTIENDSHVQFELSSSSGQLIHKSETDAVHGNHTYKFAEGAKLRSGIYFLKIITEENSVTIKLLKK